MDSEELRIFIEGAVALGLGLFIGIEREYRHIKEEGGIEGTILGVRTFALLGLLGWVSELFREIFAWLPLATLAVTSLLILAQYLHAKPAGHGFGITTELAAILTVVLGMVVHHRLQYAVAIAIATTAVLISKPWFRNTLPQLKRHELTATLQLLLVVFILLPLLPAAPVDPWNLLPPRLFGIFVVAIAGLSYVGYVLTRLLGPGRAAGITGFLGGLASSTAVTASMAEQAKRRPGFRRSAQKAIFIANAVMCGRIMVITFLVAPSVATALVAPLAGMALVMLVAAFRADKQSRKAAVFQSASDKEVLLTNPFALLPALKFGTLLCGVMIIGKLAQDRLGDAGFLLTAAVTGLTDIDAITVVATRQVAETQMTVGVAVTAITLGILSNTIVKVTMAWLGAGREFARYIAVGSGIAILTGTALAMIQFF